MERFTTLLFFVIFSNLFITSRAGCLPSACITTFPSSIVNMSHLCNGGNGHTFVNETTGQTYRFEICGSIDAHVTSTSTCGGPGSTYPCTISGAKQTNTYCNPEYNAYPFEGSFLQFFDPNPATDCNRGACPNTGFLSPSLQNQQDYCCTGQCEVIDVARPFIVEYINGSGSGVTWTSTQIPPDNGDEFECPVDPLTGHPRARTAVYVVFCNANGSITDPLLTIAAYDDDSCRYTIVMSHFVACGEPILPSPSPSPTSSPSTTSTPGMSIPLITSISLASIFGSIVFAGIGIYSYNRLRSYIDDFEEDDENERAEPILRKENGKHTLYINSIPNELTDEQIYINQLPKKFKEYLVKQGAVDPSTGTFK